MSLPVIQPVSPGRVIAKLLIQELGPHVGAYTFVDFCAGAGGPVPILEKEINDHLRHNDQQPTDFVLTDLFPNIPAWKPLVRGSPHINFESEPVDASKAPRSVTQRGDGRRVMRLFHLAFHHFDDDLAQDILRNTIETGQGFSIFELQNRSLLSCLLIFLHGLLLVIESPYNAWVYGSLGLIFFNCIIPVLPLVCIFDGWVSALRTRTSDEVEVLLRGCGADSSEWEIRSGSTPHIWPIAYVDWIICKPVERS